MNAKQITLKQLCFTGPEVEKVCVEFHAGLNIIYGASDTGKSFILESIDFMFGSSEELRDIQERVPYNQIWLTVEKPDGNEATLVRSTDGGDFTLYEGKHSSVPDGVRPQILKAKHDATKIDNVSAYILNLLGLYPKKIRKKVDGTLVSFSLPYLRHLSIVSETDIQKRGSPIINSAFPQVTADMAAFKLLLTGVDDSALVKADADSTAVKSRAAKLEVVEELITSYENRRQAHVESTEEHEELTDQLERLNLSLTEEQSQLSVTEGQYREFLEKRSGLRAVLEKDSERRTEIGEMLERFKLLKQHYISDIERLDGIQEAGSLIAALSSGHCPLCGSEAASHPETTCDANPAQVVAAAVAEKSKIEHLLSELEVTIQKLESEILYFDRTIPQTSQALTELDSNMARLSPSVSHQRANYQALVDKRAAVQAALVMAEELAELKELKAKLEGSTTSTGDDIEANADISVSVLDAFSQQLEATLQSWNFPNAKRVHFDKRKKDFVIDGKPRGSRGKGIRAITHAAFTASLLEYCQANKRAHLGFVVMDTPLLAYREPEAGDEEVTAAKLDEMFYGHLSKWTNRQAIIIENTNPPDAFRKPGFATFFSGNLEKERAGLFPTPKPPEPETPTLQP